LPSVSQTLPGFEVAGQLGVFVPARTGAATIARLSQEIVAILRQKDVRDSPGAQGFEMTGTTVEEFAAIIVVDRTRLGGLSTPSGLNPSSEAEPSASLGRSISGDPVNGRFLSDKPPVDFGAVIGTLGPPPNGVGRVDGSLHFVDG
jgi:hypothetical protein